MATIQVLSTATNYALGGVNDILVTGLTAGCQYKLLVNGSDTRLRATANSSGKASFDLINPSSGFTVVNGKVIRGSTPNTVAGKGYNQSGSILGSLGAAAAVATSALTLSVEPVATASTPTKSPAPPPGAQPGVAGTIIPVYTTTSTNVLGPGTLVGTLPTASPNGTYNINLGIGTGTYNWTPWEAIPNKQAISISSNSGDRTVIWSIGPVRSLYYGNYDSTGTLNSGALDIVGFQISTGIQPLWYVITGCNAGDLEDGKLSGQVETIAPTDPNVPSTGSIASTIVKRFKSTYTSSTNKIIKLELRQGSATGTVLTETTIPVTINSTADPVYTITPNRTTATEVGANATVSWTISSPAPTSQRLFYTNSGNTVASDFTDGVNSGEVPGRTIVQPGPYGSTPRTGTGNGGIGAGGNQDSLWTGTEFTISKLGGVITAGGALEIAGTNKAPYPKLQQLKNGQWVTVKTASEGDLYDDRDGNGSMVYPPADGKPHQFPATDITKTYVIETGDFSTAGQWALAYNAPADDVNTKFRIIGSGVRGTTTGGLASGVSRGTYPTSREVYDSNGLVITKTIKQDYLTENPETIILNLRLGSTTGTILANAATVTVTSTSNAFYSIIPNTVDVDEGQEVVWNILYDSEEAQTLYYSANGTISAADFVDNTLSGTVTAGGTLTNSSRRTASISKTLLTGTVEGDETIIMYLRTGSVSGPIVANSATVTVHDAVGNTDVKVTVSDIAINEGENVTWTVTANGISTGTVLYYTANSSVANSVDRLDFVATPGSAPGANTLEGSFVVSGNATTVVGSFTKDTTVEYSNSEPNDPEIISMLIRTGSTTGPVIARAPIVYVTNKFIPANTVYIVNSDKTRVIEGNTVTFTVSTQNFGNGTLYYTNSGNTVAADFVTGTGNGSITITNDGGNSFTLAIANDAVTEGEQSIIMQLRTGSESGPVVATWPTVIVADYVAPENPATYNMTTASSSVREGATITWNINTTNVANSTTLYYTLSANSTVTAADLTSAANGTVVINDNRGSFNTIIANDVLVDDNEKLLIDLRTTSETGTIVATSPIITIRDVPVEPSEIPITYFANIVPIIPPEPPILPNPVVTETITKVSVSSNTRDLGVIKSTTIYGNGNQTPLSAASLYFDYVQTFFIDPKSVDNAQNVSLSDIELFFSRKPDRVLNQSQIENPGVYVYICQVKDGVPDLSKVYVQSKIRNDYDQIFPSADAQTPTLFQFTRPVTLKTGEYYGIVINFEDPQFSLWEATNGQLVLGTRQTCSSTYNNGKLFRASNYLEIDKNPNTLDEVIKAVSDSDLKFNVNILEFDTTSATVELTNADYEFLSVDMRSFASESEYAFGIGERVYQDFGNNAANVTFYKQGNIIVDNSSIPPTSLGFEFTGTGTKFTSDCRVGDYIVITDGSMANTVVRKITNIANDTSIALDRSIYFSSDNTQTPPIIGSGTPVYAKYKLTAVGKFDDLKSNTVILTDSNADSRVRFIHDGINYITYTPGQGYANTDYITFSGIGATLNGKATITTSSTGNIVGINIVNTGYGFSTSPDLSPTVTVYKSDGSLGNTSATITATVGSQLKGEVTRAKIDVFNVIGLQVNSLIPDIHVDVKNGSISDYNINFAYRNGSSYVFRDETYRKFAMEPLSIDNYNATILSKSLEILNRNTLSPSTSEGKSSIIKFVIQSNNKYESPDLENQLARLFTFTNIINNDATGENTSSGRAYSRHISKKINFAKDRFAEDIRVYATMWKPVDTDVKIYARIHNSKDSDAFDDKDWSELELKDIGPDSKLVSDLRKKDDLIELQYGFRSYPTISRDISGTASFNAFQSNTTVIGVGTQFDRELANGDMIVLYDPLDANTTYAVALVANTPSPTAFEIHKAITNNSILAATLKIGKVSNPHMAFNNIQNDNVVRYYSTSLTEFDGYDTLSIKIVPLASSTYIVPAIDDIRVIGVSA